MLFFFYSLFIFRGYSTQEPASNRVTILLCGPTQEPILAAARGFEKNAGEWTIRVEISKEEIVGGERSMYGYTLTYPRLYRDNLQGLCSQHMVS